MREVIKRAKAGDQEAKLYIINKFMPLIYKTSMNVYVTGYQEEDLRQIAIVSILKAIEKYKIDSPTGFAAYVKAAIMNNFKYLIRGKARENYVKSLNETNEEGFELETVIPMDFDLEEYTLHKETKKKLKNAIEELNPEEKEMLYFFFERDYGGIKEYALIKGISYKAAYKFKNSLINKLKDYIV